MIPRQFRRRAAGLTLVLSLVAILPGPATAAAPGEAFQRYLAGPWGKSTTTGEPIADIIPSTVNKPGGAQFTRKACPPEGLSSPADMISAEQWFDTAPNGAFGRRNGGSRNTDPQVLTFVRAEGPDTAVFEFYNASLGMTATYRIERLGPDLIRTTTLVSSLNVQAYYVRCRKA